MYEHTFKKHMLTEQCMTNDEVLLHGFGLYDIQSTIAMEPNCSMARHACSLAQKAVSAVGRAHSLTSPLPRVLASGFLSCSVMPATIGSVQTRDECALIAPLLS